MQYGKRRIIIRNKQGDRGIVTLEQGDQLAYRTEVITVLPPGTQLILLVPENQWVLVEGLKGTHPTLNMQQVQGAALVAGNALIYWGSAQPQDWEAIQRDFAAKTAAPSQKDAVAPAVGAAPVTEDWQAAVAPVTEDWQAAVAPVTEDWQDAAAPVTQDWQDAAMVAGAREKSAPAQPVFAAAEECGFTPQIQAVSPFPGWFADASWQRVEYPAGTHYLRGEIRRDGQVVATAVAMPGPYSVSPPAWLKGFDVYLNDDQGAGGYWVLLRDAKTGQVMPIQSLL